MQEQNWRRLPIKMQNGVTAHIALGYYQEAVHEGAFWPPSICVAHAFPDDWCQCVILCFAVGYGKIDPGDGFTQPSKENWVIYPNRYSCLLNRRTLSDFLFVGSSLWIPTAGLSSPWWLSISDLPRQARVNVRGNSFCRAMTCRSKISVNNRVAKATAGTTRQLLEVSPVRKRNNREEILNNHLKIAISSFTSFSDV